MDFPPWFDRKTINETLFCEEYLAEHPMVSVNDTFFTKNGRVTDENWLKKLIYDQIKPYVTGGIARKITGILDVLRVECYCPGLALYQDRIHVANGTLFMDGRFSEHRDFCRNRLPVAYTPNAQ